MKKVIIVLLIIFIPQILVFAIIYIGKNSKAPLYEKRTEITSVDHKKFKELQKEFESPYEVIQACLSCHTERGKELMNTAHWNWERESYTKGRGVVYHGKKNAINNYCIGIGGSEQSCTRCHIGYGYEDKNFDFGDELNIDCLVCHDNTGIYQKGRGMAGYPVEGIDLSDVAQNIGTPGIQNCGICHFFSGGGNNIKHGDLEISMLDCTNDLDVHMANDGENLTCIECHKTKNHKLSGKLFSVSSMNENRVSCEQCHTNYPHKDNLLNEHTVKIACQTCHIPVYAKESATKMSWDWSTSGKMDKDGKPYSEVDSLGNITYLSIKGSFTWAKNVKPEYVWFNGTADHYIIGDQVDTSKVIKINTLYGDYNDENSKIIPVKIHRAKQIYDCKNKIIIQPKLYAEEKGKGGYWQDFDWDLAAKMGMQSVNQPYSGKFCFVNTEMYWPINHMVSVSDDALKCIDCHVREGGRIENLNNFYMPGRDHIAAVDNIGIILLILTFAGVLIHAVIRIIANKKTRI